MPKILDREPTKEMITAMLRAYRSSFSLAASFVAAYDAAPELKQEPVEYQFQGRNGFWCRFDDPRHYRNTVKDGSWPIRALYAFPPDAQAEIERCDARIKELEERRCEICGYAEHHREHTGCLRVLVKEQSAEIARLKAVIGKCEKALIESRDDVSNELDECKLRGANGSVRSQTEQLARHDEALAAIKEEGL